MAYSKKLRNKFIELLAEEYSMSEISRKLNISLPTLNNWKEEAKHLIFNYKKKLQKEKEVEIERLITERVRLINNELEKAYKALEKINLKEMKTKNLLYFIEKLENEFGDSLLKDREKPNTKTFVTVDEFGEESEEIEKRWQELI